MSLSKLKKLTADPLVRQVALGQGLRDPDPVISTAKATHPGAKLRAVKRVNLHKNGKGVLVGIIDVQGFDFAHPDFLVKKKTRFEAIWDMGADADGTSPKDYGRVISRAQMNKALAANVGAPATQLEPQSEMDFGSHGTHVASIAAGNVGVAREATIAGVLISLGSKDRGPPQVVLRLHAHCPRGRVADAAGRPTRHAGVDQHQPRYQRSCARLERAGQSLDRRMARDSRPRRMRGGWKRWTREGARRPTTSASSWVASIPAARFRRRDSMSTSNGPSPAVMGTIIRRTSSRSGSARRTRSRVSVRDPAGRTYGPVEPLEFIENQRLADGTFISIYNDLYHAANGANYIGIFLSPNFKAQPPIGIAAGQWTVRLHGRDIRDGRFDGWIERDDPLPLPAEPETLGAGAFLLFFRSAATSIVPRSRRSRAATAL